MSGWLTNGLPLATLPLTGNERISADTELAAGAQNQSEAISISQLASIMGGSLPMTTGRFYGLPSNTTPTTLLTVTGTLYAYPYYIAAPTVIKTIAADVTTGQTGGGIRIGMYQDNGSGYPGALVQASDGGALLGTSGAAVQTNTITLSVNAGWYWLALIASATSTMPTVAASTVAYTMQTNALLGSDTAAHFFAASGQAATGISVAAAYGSLLSIGTSFPTGATLVQNADVPLIALGT